MWERDLKEKERPDNTGVPYCPPFLELLSEEIYVRSPTHHLPSSSVPRAHSPSDSVPSSRPWCVAILKYRSSLTYVWSLPPIPYICSLPGPPCSLRPSHSRGPSGTTTSRVSTLHVGTRQTPTYLHPVPRVCNPYLVSSNSGPLPHPSTPLSPPSRPPTPTLTFPRVSTRSGQGDGSLGTRGTGSSGRGSRPGTPQDPPSAKDDRSPSVRSRHVFIEWDS